MGECHSVMVFKWARNIGCTSNGIHELLFRWGDRTILRDNAYYFESVDFGDGCLGDSYVDSYCDAENEILFEFFLYKSNAPAAHWNRSGLPLFSYALNELSTSDNDIIHLEGEAPVGETAFIYERKCVPRSSCLEFYMGYPSNTTSSERVFDNIPHSIRLDGVVYSEGELLTGLGSEIFTRDKSNQTTSLGYDCTVETMCNTKTEDLLKMEFTVAAPDEMEQDGGCQDDDFISGISGNDFRFNFAVQNASNWVEYLKFPFEDFKVNHTYAFLSCLPNDGCAEVKFSPDNPVTNYKIFYNEEEVTENVITASIITAPDSYYDEWKTTQAGDCEESGAATLSLLQGGLMTAALTVLPLLYNSFW